MYVWWVCVGFVTTCTSENMWWWRQRQQFVCSLLLWLSFVVDLCKCWPGTFVSTIGHPLQPPVQTFAFSVLFFLICLNVFKHVWHTYRCIVGRIILCNSGGGHNTAGTYHWCASCKLPMKVLYSDSLHADEADYEGLNISLLMHGPCLNSHLNCGLWSTHVLMHWVVMGA